MMGNIMWMRMECGEYNVVFLLRNNGGCIKMKTSRKGVMKG